MCDERIFLSSAQEESPQLQNKAAGYSYRLQLQDIGTADLEQPILYNSIKNNCINFRQISAAAEKIFPINRTAAYPEKFHHITVIYEQILRT